MIKLYGIPRSRTIRPLWMLEELGLPYENVKVSFVNETRTPAAGFKAVRSIVGSGGRVRDGNGHPKAK